MKQRYLTKSAVFLIIRDEQNQFLFQRRQNTGYMDGRLDLGASGHIEEGESAKSAALREMAEEINLNLPSSRLSFVGVNHRNSHGEVYYDFYFLVQLTSDEKSKLKINEPEKMSELKWLKSVEFSDEIIDYNRQMIEAIDKEEYYFEYGWEHKI